MPESLREKYKKKVADWATGFGISPELLMGVLDHESGWSEDVATGKRRGASGELGLGQFMPSTAANLAKQWGVNWDPLNADDAIWATAKYLGQLVKKYNGNTEQAAAAYNAGEPDVDAAIKSAGSKSSARPGGGLNLGSLIDSATLGITNFSSSWQEELRSIQKSKYKGAVDTVGNYLPAIKKRTQGVTEPEYPGTSRRTTGGTTGTGATPRMPTYDEFLESAGGDTVQAYRDYLDMLKSQKANERTRLSDMASYLELLGNQVTQEIAAGGLTLQQGAAEFNRRLDAFESGVKQTDTLSKYAVPTNAQGYAYGFEPNGLSTQLGLPTYRPTTQQVNPFGMAMDIVNQTPNLAPGVPDRSRYNAQVGDFERELNRLLSETAPVPNPYGPGNLGSDNWRGVP